MTKWFCYNENCNIVQTGFQIEQYYVCTHCKQEVDTALKEKVEAKQKQKKDREKKDLEPEQQDFWEFL